LGMGFRGGAGRLVDICNGTLRARFQTSSNSSALPIIAPNLATAVTEGIDGKYERHQAADGSVDLWHIPSGDGVSLYPGTPSSPAALRFNYWRSPFSPDGKLLAVYEHAFQSSTWLSTAIDRVYALLGNRKRYGTSDHVRIWDVATCQSVAVVPDCTKGVFSPDGRTFAARGTDDMIHIWDIPPRKPMGLVFTIAAAAGVLTWLTQWCLRRLRRPRALQ
jgi:WD40 repeat protein